MNSVSIAIAAKKPGSVSEAEDHIPGSVIRGAIASLILQLSNQQTPGISEQSLATGGGEFEALFLSDEPAIFQNAYPAIAKIADESNLHKSKPNLISEFVEEEGQKILSTWGQLIWNQCKTNLFSQELLIFLKLHYEGNFRADYNRIRDLRDNIPNNSTTTTQTQS